MEREEQNVNQEVEEIELVVSEDSNQTENQETEKVEDDSSYNVFTLKRESVDKNSVLKNYLDAQDEDVSVPEKAPSIFVRFFSNLKYMLSYTPALITTFVGTLISLLGMTFFINQKARFASDQEVVTACMMMIAIFAFFLSIFAILFISSIFLNIIRYRQGKR